MKKYLISLISILISIICMFFNFTPYSISFDLFFLPSVAWLFFKIGIVTGLTVLIISFFQEPKDVQ